MFSREAEPATKSFQRSPPGTRTDVVTGPLEQGAQWRFILGGLGHVLLENCLNRVLEDGGVLAALGGPRRGGRGEGGDPETELVEL